MKTSAVTSLGVALSLVALLAVSGAQAAKIKCWKNKEGFRECGNTVPLEYAQQAHEEKSESGVTKGKKGAARDAETARAERLAKHKAAKAARLEQKRRQKQAVKDRVLLDTFATEEDVDLVHNQNMGAIQSRINHSKDHIGKLEETLAEMQKAAADEQRAGKKVSDKELADIDDVQRQIWAYSPLRPNGSAMWSDMTSGMF